MSNAHEKTSAEIFRDRWIDLHQEKGMHILDAHKENVTSNLNTSVVYAKLAINGAFLLNGATGIAIVYNLKTLGELGIFSLGLCALGALLAVLSSGIAHIAQVKFANVDTINSDIQIEYYFGCLCDVMSYNGIKTQKRSPKKYTTAHVLRYFALSLWFASCACFFGTALKLLYTLDDVLPGAI